MKKLWEKAKELWKKTPELWSKYKNKALEYTKDKSKEYAVRTVHWAGKKYAPDYYLAQDIVREAQTLAFDRAKVDARAGVDIAGDNGVAHILDLEKEVGRTLPYRRHLMVPGKTSLFEIRLPSSLIVLSSGNEWMNNINGGPGLTPKEVIERHYAIQREHGEFLASPCLMTLKQNEEGWRELLEMDAEKHWNYWCINTHGPSFVRRRESSLGDFVEWVKTARELILFSKAISRPVLVTETGGGQYHYALTKADVTFLFHLHKLIFGERMLTILYYDSDLIRRQNGHHSLRLQ